VGFACEVDAKCGTHNTVIPKAIATKHCELRTECVAKEILTDSRGRVTGVAYFDAGDKLREQPADVVVVAAAAIESARLLLNSKSAMHPNGLGNRYDWVGRNLNGHSYPGATGLFAEEVYDDVGPGAGIAVCDFNHGNPGLAGGGMLANEFIRLPYLYAGQAAPGVPRWGKGHKDYMRRSYRHNISVKGPVQEMPLFDSRVQVDPVVKDYWGMPVARLSGTRHPHTIEISRFMADKAEAWLREAGATEIWKSVPGPGLSAGQHQSGTCRMGNDPKTSVVDKNCRVHDQDNLYVIDGSVHVTNGGFNPVLTIMAIAYHASEQLKRMWKGRV
jgi:choline dehydrogenase-like flavoprotein